MDVLWSAAARPRIFIPLHAGSLQFFGASRCIILEVLLILIPGAFRLNGNAWNCLCRHDLQPDRLAEGRVVLDNGNLMDLSQMGQDFPLGDKSSGSFNLFLTFAHRRHGFTTDILCPGTVQRLGIEAGS